MSDKFQLARFILFFLNSVKISIVIVSSLNVDPISYVEL